MSLIPMKIVIRNDAAERHSFSAILSNSPIHPLIDKLISKILESDLTRPNGQPRVHKRNLLSFPEQKLNAMKKINCLSMSNFPIEYEYPVQKLS